MKIIRVAIYSGEIPSTTFIERLIHGLSLQDSFQIQLFGHIKHKKKYTSKVKVYGYSHRLSKLMLLIKYSILLYFYKRIEKNKLDVFIRGQRKNSMNLKIKYYPVLYHKPDIFHVQWAKSLSDWIWVKEFGIKLVLSLRGAHINYSPIADANLAEAYHKIFPLVDGFHAVSKAIALEAAQYGDILPKTTVIYSGIERLYMKNKKPLNNDMFKILSVGRGHWIKGYQYALDACKIVKEKSMSFNYTIVGIDQNHEEMIFQRAQLELEKEVVFINSIPYKEVLHLMEDSDLLLLPSVEEGIANVVLEAMSVETPVLTTDCGGMSEVIKEGVNGFLCPVRDSKSMAESILKISKLSSEELAHIKVEGLKTIESKHDYASMIKQFVQFYTKIKNE